MTDTYLEPSEESAAALFSRQLDGPLLMLNLLRLRPLADYSANPELAPATPVSGREAFQAYIDHTLPFLQASGGELSFLGEGGRYFIGPQAECWDLVMLVRQNSLADFLGFASNPEYLQGLGHRSAALADSRLLPLVQCPVS